MKTVFNEWYGEISVAQQRAYKKFNVSPSDHDDLVSVFGESSHAAITNAVKTYLDPSGTMFSSYAMFSALR